MKHFWLISSSMVLLALLVFGACGGCGYSFQTSRNPLKTKYGVQKIYVAPVGNRTFKPGVQNVVYNAIVHQIASHNQFKIVRVPEESDVTLRGAVTEADRTGTTEQPISNLPPLIDFQAPLKDKQVASRYTVALTCSFTLIKTDPRSAAEKAAVPKPIQTSTGLGLGMTYAPPSSSARPMVTPSPSPSPLSISTDFKGKLQPGQTIWGADFRRTKEFPSNTQAEFLGNTSALLNESDFDRALNDLAEDMMADVHEAMTDMF